MDKRKVIWTRRKQKLYLNGENEAFKTARRKELHLNGQKRSLNVLLQKRETRHIWTKVKLYGLQEKKPHYIQIDKSEVLLTIRMEEDAGNNK